MSTRIYEALNGKQGNYILPFFWQHGEDEETAGIYGGHPGYGHPGRLSGIPSPSRFCRAQMVGGYGRHPLGSKAEEYEGMDTGRLPFSHRLCQRGHGGCKGGLTEMDRIPSDGGSCRPADLRVDVDSLLSGMGIGFPLPPDGPLSQKKELLCAVLYERQDETSDALCPGYKLVTDSLRNGLLPLSLPEAFTACFWSTNHAMPDSPTTAISTCCRANP